MRNPQDYILTETESNYLEILKRAFAILSDQMDRNIRLERISNMMTPVLSRNRVYQIINDAKELYGDVIRVNKTFDRMMLREKFLRLGQMAEEVGDVEEARKCYKDAARIDDLYNHESAIFDPSQYELPQIICTTDPSVFYAHAEDISEEE